MNNKKIILAMLICIPVLLLMISTVSAEDFVHDLNGDELRTTNVVKIKDHGNVNINLDKDDFLNGKDYYDSDFDKVVKTSKNYKIQKKPTKKVKTVTILSSQSKNKIKKQIKNIKKVKGTLGNQYSLTDKVDKTLKQNKIKSYKLTRVYKWMDTPDGYHKVPLYKIKVKYYVCKHKKVVKPLKVHVHVNWQKYFKDYLGIGYLKYKDAQGFTYKYKF